MMIARWHFVLWQAMLYAWPIFVVLELLTPPGDFSDLNQREYVMLTWPGASGRVAILVYKLSTPNDIAVVNVSSELSPVDEDELICKISPSW